MTPVSRRSRRHDPSEKQGPPPVPAWDAGEEPVCALCLRPIPAQARSSRHHLIPRLKGGTHKGTVRLHQICHSAIHARFSEAELARHFSDPKALRGEERLADFLRWIAGRPPDFHAPTRIPRGAGRRGDPCRSGRRR